jgi:tRNA dimethylallyltransferase
MQPLIILVGPTAVGKTSLSIDLALHFGVEIISADSMQIYRGLDIGTAKPSLPERRGVPHHLIDVVLPDQPFTVVDYQDHYQQIRAQLEARRTLPLLTGGTGLYIRAVTQGFIFPSTPPNLQLRTALRQEAEISGREALYQRLVELDPNAARKIHPQDLKRTLRALEVTLTSGRPFSEQQRVQRTELPPNMIYIGVTRDRSELYDRINRRVEQMLTTGLVEEVASLVAKGYKSDLQSMQGLGYKELIPVVCGETKLEEAVGLIKQRTRHYAKRQETWFRREPVETWFCLKGEAGGDDLKKILNYLEGRLRQVSNRL